MKVKVDRALCANYGLCVQTVPGVFSLEEEELTIASEIPVELEDRVRRACEQCPTLALSIEE